VLRYLSDIAVTAVVYSFLLRGIGGILTVIISFFVPARICLPLVAGVLWVVFASLLAGYTLNITIVRGSAAVVYWILGGVALFFTCGGGIHQARKTLSHQHDQALKAGDERYAKERDDIRQRMGLVLPVSLLVYAVFAFVPSFLQNPISRLMGRGMDSVFVFLNAWLPSELGALVRLGSFLYVLYWAFASIMMLMSMIFTLRRGQTSTRTRQDP
jgi:hypothetical protein